MVTFSVWCCCTPELFALARWVCVFECELCAREGKEVKTLPPVDPRSFHWQIEPKADANVEACVYECSRRAMRGSMGSLFASADRSRKVLSCLSPSKPKSWFAYSSRYKLWSPVVHQALQTSIMGNKVSLLGEKRFGVTAWCINW